ncbi:hypothetical protein BJY52DRAFT_437017 [Lactarius psammicola]|nr:hypothetical protein BJY52DRAFT_437017 [Lactarius psammicola]
MADTCCAGIPSNSDIAGIGTRINVYVTILLPALVPQGKRSNELLDGQFVNAIFYGLALLITALIQTIQDQLDLYHAVFVMQVLVSLVILHLYGAWKLVVDKRLDFKMYIAIAFQVLQVLIFVPWSYYVWANDSRFGPQPQCNYFVKYVLFFVTVRATVGWLRTLAFVVLAACVVVLVLLIVSLPILRERLQSALRPPPPVVRTFFQRIFDAVFPPTSTRWDAFNERRRRIWSAGVKLFQRIFWVLSILFAILSIATIELIVHRNHSIVLSGENDWGFGQIVSAFLILPIVIEVLAIFKKDRSGGRELEHLHSQ